MKPLSESEFQNFTYSRKSIMEDYQFIKRMAPKSSGIWRGVIYLDECVQNIDLMEGQEVQPHDDGSMLLGFDPVTHEALYLRESVAPLGTLPTTPSEARGWDF